MESQTEEEADVTSPEEAEEVGKGEPVAGMTVMIIAWIWDLLDRAGMAFPTSNDRNVGASVCFLFPDYITGSRFRAGKGRGSGSGFRDGGPGRARDRDRANKSGTRALPRSLASAKMEQKSNEGVRAEPSSAPLQKIFMTNDTQEQLKELLRDLQTLDYDQTYE